MDHKKNKIRIIIILLICICCLSVLFFLFPKIISPFLKHTKASKLIDSENYDEAYSILYSLDKEDEVIENKYDRAIQLIRNKDDDSICEAYSLLGEIDFKDSKTQQENLKPQYKKILRKRADVGSTFLFGTYEQDNDITDGKEDIDWIVLKRESDRVLVVSKYILDCVPYTIGKYTIYEQNEFFKEMNDHISQGETWATCSLREWVNTDFYNNAFTKDEQELIIQSAVTADENPLYSTDPGAVTKDNVFILSTSEVNFYLKEDIDKQCIVTPYAISKGVSNYTYDNITYGSWWLRTPGYFNYFASFISFSGVINNYGSDTFNKYCGVRPALWISLND